MTCCFCITAAKILISIVVNVSSGWSKSRDMDGCLSSRCHDNWYSDHCRSGD